MKRLAWLVVAMFATNASAMDFKYEVETKSKLVKQGDRHGFSVPCKDGRNAIGGGYTIRGDATKFNVVVSEPSSPTASEWYVEVVSASPVEIMSVLRIFAICTDAKVTLPNPVP